MLHSLDRAVLYEDVLRALRAYHALEGTPRDWLATLCLVQRERQKTPGDDSPSARRRAANAVLLAALGALQDHDQLGARVLPARFLERRKAQAVANQLNLSVDVVNRAQRQAVEHLVNILISQELAAREVAAVQLEADLPAPTYVELVGPTTERDQLAQRLAAADAPWLMALTGLGGIGKTALADAVARQVIRQFVFKRVVWVRVETPHLPGQALTAPVLSQAILGDLANQLGLDVPDGLPGHHHLPQLRQALKHERLLVVIDNLESDADTQSLVEELAALAQPSKFLLTARTRPPGEAAVYVHTLRELERADAFALLRRHAALCGLHELEHAPESDLDEIYAVVGGNPLALKLVVGLMPAESLPQALDNLRHNQTGKVDSLYQRLYARVWEVLSPVERALLEAMPLAAAGGLTFEQLLAVTGLPAGEALTAVNGLVNRSLLEVRGGVRDRRYGIHRLTERFLRAMVDWRD